MKMRFVWKCKAKWMHICLPGLGGGIDTMDKALVTFYFLPLLLHLLIYQFYFAIGEGTIQFRKLMGKMGSLAIFFVGLLLINACYTDGQFENPLFCWYHCETFFQQCCSSIRTLKEFKYCYKEKNRCFSICLYKLPKRR